MFCFLSEAPGSPIITLDVQASSVSVTWTAPDNGGSPVTGYRVVLLQSDSVIRNESVTNKLSWSKGELIKNTSYTVKVSARNFVFEGNAAEKKLGLKMYHFQIEARPGTEKRCSHNLQSGPVKTWTAVFVIINISDRRSTYSK